MTQLPRLLLTLALAASAFPFQGCSAPSPASTPPPPPPPPTPPPATPGSITAASSTTMSATAGLAVATPPRVIVRSTTGAVMAGIEVTFAVTSGGGSLTNGDAVTNDAGIATAGQWTLGVAAGINTMTATVAGLPPVTFIATGTIPPPTLTVTPDIAAAAPSTTVALAARNSDGTPQAVDWRVDGVPGGSAGLGIVSPTGVYTAPGTIPAGDSVVVSAVLLADTTVRRSATIFFIPDLIADDYYVALPRVLDMSRPTAIRFLLVPPPSVTSVTFMPEVGYSAILTPIGQRVMTFVLDSWTAVIGYQTGTLHNFVGHLDYRDAAGARVKLTNLSLNVRDATMPDVGITAIAPDAQRSMHLLNLRVDAATIYPDHAIVSRALQLLGGDQFDFVAVIATVTTNNNRVYMGIRNDVSGTGMVPYDNSAAWGGAGHLRGAIAFPIDAFFDGAEGGTIHEIGHAWINFATDPVLAPARPHWPPSTMASGVMGFNIPGSSVGGQFPWQLIPLGDGSVRINRTTPSDRFTPLDLYLMGLLPPDSVPPMQVLPGNVNPNAFVDGMTSPATTYTIADYIAGQGVRQPSHLDAPHEFTLAVVILSYGRLLTPAEMAFFDHASARGETTVELQSTAGLVTIPASGFFLATGGRATLQTRLP